MEKCTYLVDIVALTTAISTTFSNLIQKLTLGEKLSHGALVHALEEECVQSWLEINFSYLEELCRFLFGPKIWDFWKFREAKPEKLGLKEISSLFWDFFRPMNRSKQQQLMDLSDLYVLDFCKSFLKISLSIFYSKYDP